MQGEKSLIESASILLENEKKPLNLYDLFDRVTADAGLSAEAKKAAITKFYTDLTISAKFIYVGNNEWNLKVSEKIELWEKDGSFYNEYTVVELPDEYKEAAKPKKPKKLTKAAKAKLEKAEAAKLKAEEAEALKAEKAQAKADKAAAKKALIEETKVIEDAVVEPVLSADGTPIVAPVDETTGEVIEEENVLQEYDEFDEEKYNEYMDTYEDQYKD